MKIGNYTDDIKELMNARKEINPRYSLRALSRDLNIDQGQLVNILKGKAQVSPRVAFLIGRSLKLPDDHLLEYIIPALKLH